MANSLALDDSDHTCVGSALAQAATISAVCLITYKSHIR